MPALATIIINDGKATPVAHTFSPSGPDKNGANYLYDRVGGVAIGFPELSISLKEPPLTRGPGASSDAKTRNYRALVKIAMPVLESTSAATGTGIAPAPTVAYSLIANLEFLLPERCTLADRKDIIAFAKNALAHATVNTVLQDLENLF